MNSEAAAGIAGGDLKIAGKYHDFKIYLNNNHRTETDVTVPTNGPTSMDGDTSDDNNVTDWDYSVLHTQDPDGNNAPSDEFKIMLLGAHQGSDNAWDAISLVRSYVMGRTFDDGSGVPTTAAAMSTDPLINLFDLSDTHDDVLDDLAEFNDKPPYDTDGVYADTIMRAQGHAFAQAGGNLMLPGFCVPFGLLEVLTTCGGDNTVKVLIEMAPGPYHGVYAERIV